MKIEVMVHCGNAPKMERVIDLTIAMVKKDINLVKSLVREAFVWKTMGKENAVSLNELANELENQPAVTGINVKNALSHGKSAMCEGTLTLKDGRLICFCNVALFVNTAKDALVKEAHTYFVNKE